MVDGTPVRGVTDHEDLGSKTWGWWHNMHYTGGPHCTGIKWLKVASLCKVYPVNQVEYNEALTKSTKCNLMRLDKCIRWIIPQILFVSQLNRPIKVIFNTYICSDAFCQIMHYGFFGVMVLNHCIVALDALGVGSKGGNCFSIYFEPSTDRHQTNSC